jgi:dihydrodipicolinate synthase/N-acetylneuraminate lyase
VVRTLGETGLRGVKDSTKSFERLLAYLECGVDVLTGTDAFVRDSLAAGAAGCVSAVANVRPDLLCALRDGAGAEAQDEILSLRARLPFARLKDAVAELLPGYPTAYRSPLG